MEIGAEAKRIMVVALGKLYTSRTQRGGLRLHRSLLLTLVMNSARDMYHAAAQTAEVDGVVVACERGEVLPDSPVGSNVTTEKQTVSGQPETSTRGQGDVIGAALERGTEPTLKQDGFTHGHTQQSRKRRGQISLVPDFLPFKKAKLDCPAQLVVLMDVTCSGLGAALTPIHLHSRTIAAC